MKKDDRWFLARACADLHATFRNPPCRDDDMRETLARVLQRLAERKTLILAGDIVDNFDVPYEVSREIARQLTNKVVLFVYGSHDLPQHNYQQRHRGAIALLNELTNWYELHHTPSHIGDIAVYGASWEIIPPVPGITLLPLRPNVLVTHMPLWVRNHAFTEFHGAVPSDSVQTKARLSPYCYYDLIVSGDNHRPFIHTTESQSYTGRTVWLNCGPSFRLDASEVDIPACAWDIFWSAERREFSIEKVLLPDAKLSRDHLEEQRQEELLVSKFVKSLKQERTKHDFLEELTVMTSDPKVMKATRRLVWEAVDRARKSVRK
jgi:predicted phosphodiesterase